MLYALVCFFSGAPFASFSLTQRFKSPEKSDRQLAYQKVGVCARLPVGLLCKRSLDPLDALASLYPTVIYESPRICISITVLSIIVCKCGVSLGYGCQFRYSFS